MAEFETHDFDVVVVGAGGAGLRAAVEASAAGARTALVCKSLLGKAHTVMAEGGIAAALGNVYPEDNWRVPFPDPMPGGRLLKDGPFVAGAIGYWRETGKLVVFKARAVVLATGGIGKCWKITSNSWEYTGDGMAMALEAGADLIDMEMVQFHPTGMIWPPSVRGILVTEGVRGDGGTLRNASGERFMFRYIPEFFKAETADNEAEADAWYEDKKNNRRTPDLLPRDEVARAINAEVKAGRGSPHGGVFLDICTRRPADYIRKRLPSMYHQFKELAGVDITKEPMEVGPTCHYQMGGVRVDADTAATSILGLFAAGEVAAGLHGANRLGGNSLSDLLVFGRRAGLHAAEYASGATGSPTVDVEEV